MTALDRARGWFIAPPEGTGDEPAWCADPSTEQGRVIRSFRLPEVEKHTSHADPPATSRGATTSALQPPAEAKPRLNGWRPPTARDDDGGPAGAHPDAPAVPPDAPTDARSDLPAPEATVAGEAGSDLATSARDVTSAAVLGRPGEVEPVAAALALALRRDSRAATATVAVVGAALPELAEGGGAARKLGARLAAHGFEARARGRLAWVRLDPGDGQLAKTARRLTLIGAPAVLAVTAPRNADTDRALLDCDLLVIVTADPEGPLASLAAAGLAGVPVTTVRPLGRGPARALARAGIRSTSAIRGLLSTELEEQP